MRKLGNNKYSDYLIISACFADFFEMGVRAGGEFGSKEL